MALPEVYLARHGETRWSLTGQHTGLTDIALTDRGEVNAARLGERLQGMRFRYVFASPLQRARRTCELAGFGNEAAIDPDLVEWNYGDYEGQTTVQIREACPGWSLFRDGCPGGESIEEVMARADRVVDRLRSLDGKLLLFSSGHFLRVLTARWLDADIVVASRLLLSTATLSTLGYDHNLNEPVIRLWNDARHVLP
jgi:probable phosphoglycerate mutase